MAFLLGAEVPGNGIDLLAIDCGTVIAAAGCGKTHLIAQTLKRYTGRKPILVLTHTNAGVVALRGRLNRACVSSKVYRLYTIDGWAMRLISMFPMRSGHDPDILKVLQPRNDYPFIREAAIKLLKAGHVSDILAATYERLIVDEYQDCSIYQHGIVTSLAQILPTCVLGDPLQAIFGFGTDRLVNWEEDVCVCFPLVEELVTPWRWINANAEPLGRWLLDVRGMLLRGDPIDLSVAPDAVSWVELNGRDDIQRRREAALMRLPDNNGCVLIIGDSVNPKSQCLFASQTPGAVTVEAVDMKDLISFAHNFDLSSTDALTNLIQFAQSVMTNVGASNLIQRIRSLSHGTAHNPPTEIEQVALAFVQSPSHRAAVDLLVSIGKGNSVRAYRPTVLRACIKALHLCSSTAGMSFNDAVLPVREQYRMVGRPLPRRAVGSTLLLKGLEADAVVILNAGNLNTRNLYVAMTRGSRALTICSQTPILNPVR